MIDMINYVNSGWFNIRQALKQSRQTVEGEVEESIPPMLGASLIVSVEKALYDVYKHLWGPDFVNVWDKSHFSMMTDVLSRWNLQNLIDHHLNSPVGLNIFMTLSP